MIQVIKIEKEQPAYWSSSKPKYPLHVSAFTIGGYSGFITGIEQCFTNEGILWRYQLTSIEGGVVVSSWWVEKYLHILQPDCTGHLKQPNSVGALVKRYSQGERNFSGSLLRKTDLKGLALQGINLSVSDLADTKLSGSDLSHANLSESNLQNADLSEANLFKANLLGTTLENANLRNADLRGADLMGADLREVALSGANLAGADLFGAVLWDVDLGECNLSGTNIEKANFEKAY